MSVDDASGEWWARVSHQFSSHVREEAAFLTHYEELVGQVDDEAVAFLVRLILDDERRHHALFESMSDAARGADDRALPAAPRTNRETARTLLEPTERFLAAERDDQAELRRLRKDLKPARADTLWPLMVRLMEIDTEKHIQILEYLRDRLRLAAKG
jgi:rubrerythrin